MCKQRYLVAKTAAVARKSVVRADHAVARNYYSNRVPPNRTADRARRDFCAAVLFGDCLRYVAIRHRGAEGNPLEFVDHFRAKLGQVFYAIVGRKAGVAPGEILVKPAACLAEYRRLAQFDGFPAPHGVTRARKPEPCQRLAVPAHHEIVKPFRRLVFPDVFHTRLFQILF